MAQEHRIYHRFRPWRFLGRLLLVLIALALFLTVFFYVWFKRYIVYTDDGLYLDVPWLQDPAEPTPERTTPVLSTPDLISPDVEITAPWEQGGTDTEGDIGNTAGDETDTSFDSDGTAVPE